MRNRILAAAALAGAACLASALSAQPVGGDVRGVVEQKFELNNFSIQRLDLPPDNDPFVTELTLGATTYGVWVEPQSFRTEGARATTVNADGQLVDIPLPPHLTVRAQLEGVPDARAAGSRMGGGLHLTIALPGEGGTEIWTVQPLYDAVDGADTALVVVSRADDAKPNHEWTCGVDDRGIGQAEADGGTSGARAFLVCETATDADFEFFGKNGSSEANTIADIDAVMARISAVYEGQCNVTFLIPHYQIWTTSADPYTSTDSGTRLSQVRNWWQANMGAVHRDLCHAFTGVNIDGSVIGIAWLSAVCTTNGYGLVQSRYTIAMNSRGALSAHEIGHNFSANHCDGSGDCHIMCSALGGCDGLGNPAYFGVASANRITNYAAGRACLDEGGLVYPFFEDWADANIDPIAWVANSGGAISAAADNEPSPPNSLNLDGTDSIESGAIDISNVVEPPFVSFHAEHKGVEAGKTLVCQYRDFFNNWNTLITFSSDGADQTEFGYQTAEVPIAGWSENFAIRFIAQGADSTDDWYIDDIAVAPFAGNAVPFLEEFDSTTLDGNVWGTTVGAQVVTDATNEPSEPYSLALDATDSAESNNFLMSGATFPSYLSFFTQHKGVESGKTLLVEYLNINGNWNTFTTVPSNGADQNSFAFYQAQVPFDSYHDDFAFRFRAQGADATDDWYIDDIRIGDEFTPPDDCYADFNDDGSVNTVDVLAFLNAWSAGNASADCNDDGSVNTVDVLCFLNLWNAGC
jgi:hypothetical protein